MITLGVFLLLAVLMFGGMPIGFAMLASGYVGFSLFVGWEPGLHMVGQTIQDSTVSYTLSVLPLFILMGNFVARSRLADDLFAAADAFVGHRRGGLAHATVLACGGFAAVCGSSAATAATMVKVALPAMRARNYDDALSLGAIAAGGTLGILIPPSAILLLYGIATETSVPLLFAAGILPGIVAIMLLAATIFIWVAIKPELGPAGPRVGWKARRQSLAGVWGVVLLFALIMGGILGGVFTASEGGGIGAFGALLFALWRRAISWTELLDVLVETAVTSAMIFAIVFGAFVFSNFVVVSGVPGQLGEFVRSLNVSPIFVMLIIIVIYALLGVVLEEVSMMLMTLPIFFPIVTGLGFDPIWFGVVLVVVVELGMITPPIGINLFVIQALVPGVTMRTLLIATTPFSVALLVLLVLLVFFPQMALVIPRALG
jgi:C4-dicarboxylate transporter DctM subunit